MQKRIGVRASQETADTVSGLRCDGTQTRPLRGGIMIDPRKVKMVKLRHMQCILTEAEYYASCPARFNSWSSSCFEFICLSQLLLRHYTPIGLTGSPSHQKSLIHICLLVFHCPRSLPLPGVQFALNKKDVKFINLYPTDLVYYLSE